MMTFSEFHNALRILSSIDMRELVHAGAISDDDTGGWQSFRDNPWRWFIRAGDDEAAAVWRIIESRQPKKVPDPILGVMGFGGSRYDELIGWRGSRPSTPDLFRCEFCDAEHLDCTLIQHSETCPVTLCRAAAE